MCDGGFNGGCGEMGGLGAPMNNTMNTMGVGDICWDAQTNTGSGDRFDMTFGGWYHGHNSNGIPKKKRLNGVGGSAEFNQFRSQGSKTSGGYDFSPRPLYVPVGKK